MVWLLPVLNSLTGTHLEWSMQLGVMSGSVALLLAVGVSGESAAQDFGLGQRLHRELTAFGPAAFFSIRTYDEVVRTAYDAEYRLRRAMRVTSRAALLLVLAGLWSVSRLAALQREREFGIRKVLGAQSRHVAALHVRDFVLLMPVAYVVGAGGGFWLVTRWLERFAYRSTELAQPLLDAFFVLGILTATAVLAASLGVLLRRPIESLGS